jgi:hypothetical protein
MPAAKKVDTEALAELARYGASDKQLCHVFRISQDTLARRFRALIDRARSDGAVWVLRRIHDRAARGCWPALEMLAVHLVGWTKAHAEQTINVTQINSPAVPQLTMEEFKRQTLEAEQMAQQYFNELQAQKRLTDGNGSGEVGSL